jgi:hypothetical protein
LDKAKHQLLQAVEDAVIDRSGQLWISKQTNTYRYVISSCEGVWVGDNLACVWHEFINLEKGIHGKARESHDGTWEVRRDWKRVT